MYKATGVNKRSNPEAYRDHWTDEALVAEAERDFESVWVELGSTRQPARAR